MKKSLHLILNKTRIVLFNGASFRDRSLLYQYLIRIKQNLYK